MTELEELKQLADECYEEALKHLHTSSHKLALNTAFRAKEIYSEIQDYRNEAASTNLLAIIYEEMGNMTLALQFQLDALDIALDIDAYDISAKQYNNIGSKFLTAKDYDKALIYFQSALEMSQKAKDANLYQDNTPYNFLLVVHMNLASLYCNKGDFDSAKYHYALSKEASTHTLYEELRFSYLVFEGLFYERIGESEKANEYIEPILTGIEQNEYISDYLEVCSDIIELLKSKQDFENWEKVLVLMDKHQEAFGNISLNVEILNQWLIFYKASGRINKYNEACVKFYELSTEYVKQNSEREANEIELNIEMRKTLRQKKEVDTIIYQDTLTGVGNRNKLYADCQVMIDDSVQNHTPITIGLIDVDFFKESNDTYGHIEGDKCLRSVAQIISEAIGENGNVYRYGGDEFLILMPTNDVSFINQVGNTIKTNLSNAKLPNERSPIGPYVTLSQGYTCAKAEAGDSIDSLIKIADRVLYSVKRLGRNNYKFMSLPEIYAES